MDRKEKESIGWVCPRCRRANAPTRETCKCVEPVTESTGDKRQLLTE